MRSDWHFTVASFFALIWGCLKIWLAVSLMWNVRMVSCVPGSPIDGAAIRLVDDHVMRNVAELAREVTRVSGLEGRVGQTLAGAVRRDEVLEHAQTFAEVRQNRSLDDFARGLGHQTADTCELANLLL